MKRFIVGMVACAGVASVMAGLATSAEARQLNNSQLKRLLPNSISGVVYSRGNKSSTPFVGKVRPNGTIKVSSGSMSDSGTWYIANNRFCMRFSMLSKAKLKCRVVLRKGGWYHALRINGTTKIRFRVSGGQKAGN